MESERGAKLECKIGQRALEADLVKGCLQRIDEQRRLQALNGSAQESVRTRILGCFPDADEFGAGDGHALCLQ
jgi:hypothetical protein